MSRAWLELVPGDPDARRPSLRCHHAQTLNQVRLGKLAFWQGFGEHGSGAYEGTWTPARSENEAKSMVLSLSRYRLARSLGVPSFIGCRPGSLQLPHGGRHLADQVKETVRVAKKLFVGSLSWGTDEWALRAAFERFGAVEEAVVITDAQTGRSRGFGFVTLADEAAAARAIEEMDGTELDGRRIAVNVAQERQRPRGGGGFGGGGERTGGGFGGRNAGGGRGRRGGNRRQDNDDY